MAVQNDLVSQFVHVLTDLIVLDHYHDQVNIPKELIKIMVLVFHEILLDPGVIDFERLNIPRKIDQLHRAG